MDKDNILNQSQTIRFICELLETHFVPDIVVQKVRKLCWNLADSEPKEQGNSFNDKTS